MPSRGIAVAVISTLALLAAAAHSFSQPAEAVSSPDLDNIRREVRELRQTLDRVRGQAQSAERDLQATQLELQIFERELTVAREMELSLEKQKSLAIDGIARTEDQIRKQKEFLAARLAAMYKLGSLSYARLLLSIQDEQNPLEAVTMLGYLVSRDAREIDRYHELQASLSSQMTRLREKQESIAALRAVSEQKRQAIDRKRRDQERILASLRTVSAESEQRLAVLEEKAQRLERLLTLLYEQKGSIGQEAKITDYKGAIQWPLKGPVLEAFGRQRSAKFATYTVNNGIKIGAPPGADVSAVFAGTVIYAQWFKGYGNLVVVDHGERVYTLYGNTRGSLVGVGNKVTPGQVITTVAEGEDGGGYLYFEVRENNKPADPRLWLR